MSKRGLDIIPVLFSRVSLMFIVCLSIGMSMVYPFTKQNNRKKNLILLRIRLIKFQFKINTKRGTIF